MEKSMGKKDLGKKEKSEWKRCLLELSEELFFSIMRIYLGEIRTPFHKQRLVDQLAAFLKDGETQQRMIALIDRYDAEVLTAVDLLNQPDASTLYDFFEKEREYFNFHNHLMNLQERLLIFTCPEDRRLRLNPYLEAELRRKILAPKLLFPPAEHIPEKERGTAGKPPPVLLNEELAWSFASFLLHREDLFRNDGTFRKKTTDQLRTVFSKPGTGKDPAAMHRILHSLCATGVLELSEENFNFHLPADTELKLLPRPLRLSALWAAAVLRTPGAEFGFSPQGKYTFSELKDLAVSFLRFVRAPSRDKTFSPTSIRRLLHMSGFLRLGESLLGEKKSAARDIEKGLLELRILLPHGENFSFNPEIDAQLAGRANAMPLLPHPDFSVTVKPPLEYETGRFIASLMEIKRYGTYPQFELTGKAYLHGREEYEAGEIKTKLEALTDTTIPQNVSFSLEAWENNYSSVFMIKGVVLILAEHWNRIVRHHPEFQNHVLRDLDRGMYVMNPDSLPIWRRLLQEMGVSPLPPLRNAAVHRSTQAGQEDREEERRELLSPEENARPMDLSLDFPRDPGIVMEGRKLNEELTSELQKLGMKSGEEKEVLSRIDHKLYLFPEQLRHPVLSDAVSEARGIDYAGKVRVIQQALRNRSAVLELIERSGGGKPLRHLVRPREIEKSGKELLLHGTQLPSGEKLVVRVEKIAYIKNWKSSLFVQPEDYKPS
jgi:hypothetical protein